ncbi:3-dehydroquinate synthase [Christiangramia crocea]|uniref:3-dehydroquinate synthase n=1 Tax=Christiangramia crocea TaxID=2904124 RepID=A0A9X1UY65_9FLAO|nr:3-dehydroquinate synthase [Gramella crocea]MCG9972477.1 3-dehydroquinate synthase [Gramella crocea]
MIDSTASLNPVLYAENAYRKLNDFLADNDPTKIFILVDGNTHEHCLAKFMQRLESNPETEVIEIEAGEEFKNLETCEGVWNALSELEADRKSLMINLGGGVVTDLGGFVASAFKRGISFINIPTTLLAMVDASVGGKTGVDLGNLKNQIGVINQPEMVLIDTQFLSTLPQEEMRSGLAEILKHGLIASEAYWEKVSKLDELDLADLEDIIRESVDIKKNIVTRDPFEKNIRKTLNFGHTLGHAIESYCLTHPEKKRLLHGEAIAAGMILETYISTQLQSFPKDKFENINQIIKGIYGQETFSEDDIVQIKDLMKFDKKNERGNINFVLLKDIGKPVIDIVVPDELIQKAFDRYLSN